MDKKSIIMLVVGIIIGILIFEFFKYVGWKVMWKTFPYDFLIRRKLLSFCNYALLTTFYIRNCTNIGLVFNKVVIIYRYIKS